MGTAPMPGPSREPTDWTESKHFQESYGDPHRFHTPAMVAETLLHGRDEACPWGKRAVVRKLEYDGVAVVLVLAPRERVIVTGWTEVASYARALASARWSFDDLAVLDAFMAREHKLRPGELAVLSED